MQSIAKLSNDFMDLYGLSTQQQPNPVTVFEKTSAVDKNL